MTIPFGENMDYPYNSNFVLNDGVFIAYGGRTGTSTQAQRNAAYQIAEAQMSEYLHALLQPTIVTGTFLWAISDPIVTDWGRLLSVKAVKAISGDPTITYDYTATDLEHYVIIRNATFGYVDISLVPVVLAGCAVPQSNLYPYQIQMVYESGLPTATVCQPNALLALTMAAQITLNEIDNLTLANEAMGDVGVQSFSTQGYSEIRTALGNTAFGNSAKSQKIAQLVNHLKSRVALRF